MTINAESLKLIKDSEGWVDHWYPDPATGGEPWTCCYGHTNSAGEPHYKKGQAFTKAEGEAILARDLEGVEKAVQSAVTVPLNDNQFGALVSFTFNLGAANLKKSTLLKLLNSGNYEAAADQFPVWNKAAGKVMPGLVTRRALERSLFRTPTGAAAPAPEVVPAPPAMKPHGIAAIVAMAAGLIYGILKALGWAP